MVGEVKVMFSDLRVLIYCLAPYIKDWRAARSLNRCLNVDRQKRIISYQKLLYFLFRAGQGRAGQGRAGQGRAGQGRAGQGMGVIGRM